MRMLVGRDLTLSVFQRELNISFISDFRYKYTWPFKPLYVKLNVHQYAVLSVLNSDHLNEKLLSWFTHYLPTLSYLNIWGFDLLTLTNNTGGNNIVFLQLFFLKKFGGRFTDLNMHFCEMLFSNLNYCSNLYSGSQIFTLLDRQISEVYTKTLSHRFYKIRRAKKRRGFLVSTEILFNHIVYSILEILYDVMESNPGKITDFFLSVFCKLAFSNGGLEFKLNELNLLYGVNLRSNLRSAFVDCSFLSKFSVKCDAGRYKQFSAVRFNANSFGNDVSYLVENFRNMIGSVPCSITSHISAPLVFKRKADLPAISNSVFRLTGYNPTMTGTLNVSKFLPVASENLFDPFPVRRIDIFFYVIALLQHIYSKEVTLRKYDYGAACELYVHRYFNCYVRNRINFVGYKLFEILNLDRFESAFMPFYYIWFIKTIIPRSVFMSSNLIKYSSRQFLGPMFWVKRFAKSSLPHSPHMFGDAHISNFYSIFSKFDGNCLIRFDVSS